MSKIIAQDTFTAATPGSGKQCPDLGVIVTATALLTGTGTPNASYQLEGSNTGTAGEWHAIGAAVVMSAAAAPAISNLTRVQFAFVQYRINVTALDGSGDQKLVVTTAIAS